jgi:5'-phosphate synthase pdxT subunit
MVDKMNIGILALQGGYTAHAKVLNHLGVPFSYIRQASELAKVQGLILPGGESSTALKFLQEEGLFTSLQTAAKNGLPLFGTCAGAILMAEQVTSPQQASLGLIDITIARNAYGRQLASGVAYGSCKLKVDLLEMVFIRAPRIIEVGPDVEVIAQYDNQPVCVQQHQHLLTTFHPELTSDATLHRYFINLVTTHNSRLCSSAG